MKRFTSLLLSLLLILSLAACAAPTSEPEAPAPQSVSTPAPESTVVPAAEETVEPEESPAYIREIGELIMPEFLSQLGAGYTCSALNGFDATVRYDPYQTMPVYLFFDLSAQNSEEYRANWRWRLHGGETDTVSLTLNELPDTPEGVFYPRLSRAGSRWLYRRYT